MKTATKPDDGDTNLGASGHHDPADEDQPGAELTTGEARQGETSGHMRIVLAVSLVLAVIAGVIAYTNIAHAGRLIQFYQQH